MNATKAIELLEPIPADDFIMGEFSDREAKKCCGIGHLVRLSSRNPEDYSYVNCNDNYHYTPEVHSFVRYKAREFALEKHELTFDLSQVNNSPDCNGYTEPVIKDRVMHLLRDMEEAGY